ncbi:MAG TPA: hypothetical protein VG675_24815 [Bryobacteraceae bacterium]|nr:hypothetical protein [Bryobacteraceae bacterium]
MSAGITFALFSGVTDFPPPAVAQVRPAIQDYPVTINAGSFADDMNLSFTTAGARFVYAWDSYHDGFERILARSFPAEVRAGAAVRNELEGRLAAGDTRTRELSPGRGIYYSPVAVSTGAQSGWVFWSTRESGDWRVDGLSWHGTEWTRVTTVVPVHAMLPAAAALDGKLVLAWEDDADPHSRILIRHWDGGHWSVPASVSDANLPAQRAVLAATANEVWAFWDAYDGQEYAVYTRRVLPQMAGIERLSPAGQNCLNAAAVAFGKGDIAAAWVATSEVEARGVIDHADVIQVATRHEGKWRLTSAEGGKTEIADLRHSLLPAMDPSPQVLPAYYGRRRQPMLAADGERCWLLWEGKIHPWDSGATAGQLLGRSLSEDRWSEPVVLYQGLVEYRLPQNAQASQGRIIVAGRSTENFYQSFALDLNGGKKLPDEPFSYREWKAHHWPARAPAARPSISLDGKRYFLYWADLHVHTHLTSDAEGEPDELLRLARDKVGLDAISMTENDDNSWMRADAQPAFFPRDVTAAQYALSTYLARRFTDPRKFVALPGWEWTQLHPDGRTNHRSVLFAGPVSPIVRHMENGSDVQNLCDVVEAAGGVMHAHHAVFELLNRPCDANVEVASGWGVFIGNSDTIPRALSRGFKVGFIATSDGHRRNPGFGGGLTGIYATELTPAALMEALRAHRVFATNGSRLFADARANGRFMGEEVTASGDIRLTLTLRSPKRIARASLIRDGEVIHEAAPHEDSNLSTEFTDRPKQGYHWYYWRIELEGESPQFPGNVKIAEGNLAWTSPHGVTVR